MGVLSDFTVKIVSLLLTVPFTHFPRLNRFCIYLFFTWCIFCHRYEQPKCDGNARAHPAKPKDHYKSRHLQGKFFKTGLGLCFFFVSRPHGDVPLQPSSNCCLVSKVVITVQLCVCVKPSLVLLVKETLVKKLRIARPCPSLVNKQGDRDRLGENSSSSDMEAGA